MAPGPWSCWTYLWIIVIFRSVSPDSSQPPAYTIHRSQVTFDQAVQDCSPGVLTTLSTKQEVSDILKVISESHKSTFTFWVGLIKAKYSCVDFSYPLRGFTWLNGSIDSEVIHWVEEPADTCTSLLCAAMTGGFNESGSWWGLKAITCKRTNQFICKLQTPESSQTSKKTATLKPAKLEPEPEPATPESKHPTRPEPKTDSKPTTGLIGSDPGPGSGPGLGSESCKRPVISKARALRSGPDNNRIQVECWSNDQLDLHCRGHPAVWRLPDDSLANFTTLCRRCEDGFRKDASANCVDVDECTGGTALCKHTCLNTVGSYRCVCADESGKQHEEDSQVCAVSVAVKDGSSGSGVLIPVLIAVTVLVVVVVVVAAVVACCLMRKKKKKKAERMAMMNKNSQ